MIVSATTKIQSVVSSHRQRRGDDIERGSIRDARLRLVGLWEGEWP
jgi:hypothetical protein